MSSSLFNQSKKESIYSKIPLPHAKSIRLLDILPGELGSTVECRLEVVNLDAKPVYEALSYVWGPLTPAITIICNKQPVTVTPNLGAALQRLRYPKPSTVSMLEFGLRNLKSGKHVACRRMWIDALCINQEDLDERSKQVSFMMDIYESAKNVIIWLGPDAPFTENAISLIRRVAIIALNEREYNAEDHYPVIPYDQTHVPRDDLPPREDDIWDSLYLFYENQWFRRVWVIQEAAAKSGVMITGSHEVNLFDVGVCSEWLNAKKFASTLSKALALVPSVCIFSARLGAPLMNLLVMTSQAEATNPRDKIYALLGLYSRWLNIMGMEKTSFKPNYKKNVPEVYADLVRYFIALPKTAGAEEGSLHIILKNEGRMMNDTHTTLADQDGDDPAFPSWVPRWHQYRWPWSSLASYKSRRPWIPGGTTLTRQSMRDIGDWRILSLWGFKVSTIKFVEPNLPFPGHRKECQLARDIVDEVTKNASKYPDDSWKEALARALTVTRYKDVEQEEPYGAEDLDAYLAHDAPSELGLRFGDDIVTSRAFFTTTDGYIGLGSKAMQIGDLVCVMYGGEVLFILRPVNERYRLVGECYVHGLMEGEALKMVVSGETEEQWFDLE